MKFAARIVAVIGATACTALVSAGPQATFQLLTTSDAPDVTIDEFGRTLVLAVDGGGVYIYEDGGYTFLGSGGAQDISADGTTVAGSTFNSEDVEEAIRWFSNGGSEMLGALPNTLHCPSISNGYGASADGSVIVGLSWDGCSGRAFRWTEAGGMAELQSQANGGNRASVVSDDGQIIAGFAQGTFSRTPAAWNADGTPYATYPFNPDVEGEINAMSSDGSIMGGRYYIEGVPGFYLLPFYWTESQGIRLLPSVPGFNGGSVLDVSDDGRTFVGNSGILIEGVTATVWRAEWGAADLKTKLIELGANVPDEFTPFFARGVSDDGRTVVGWGFLAPSQPGELGGTRGFVATLPPAEILPCPADLNGDGAVGFADLTQLLSAWGACPGCDEDLDDNGQVGFSDLTLMLNAWGPCP